MSYKDKKAQQLGMNPSTASGRLLKDVLFKLAVDAGHKCFQCGELLTRESFSIEHKIPWLDSEDPQKLYFDLENIAFSHLTCNIKAARKTNKKFLTKDEKLAAERKRTKTFDSTDEAKEKRRVRRNDRFIKTGKW